MRPIISIVGRSNSGKTTLMVRLITELKQRGYRLATIKHVSKGFELDKAGKDSWRFTQAGSQVVALSSSHELAIMKPVEHDLNPQELSRLIVGDYDLLLTEGFKRSNTLKIEVHRQELGGELLCSPQELLAVVTDEPLEVKVPQVAPDDIHTLADIIEARLQIWPEEATVDLWVNEAHIPLNAFAGDFIAKTLLGMVSSLNDIDEIKSLHISLRRKA